MREEGQNLRWMRTLASLVVASIVFAGCDVPRDPEKTLEKVSGGTMRVGLIDSPPWAHLANGEPAGIEVELIEDFADELEATVEWFPSSESEAFAALHVGELDVVIGGLTAQSPFSKEGALTHPYVTTQTVVGFPADAGASPDIAGREVSVEKGTAAAGFLEKTDAVTVGVDDIADVTGLRVVENWMLDDLELVDRGVQLEETDHVMAVRLGENAFMVRLERFLLRDPDRVTRLLEEAEV